ncbi:DUF5324 family protein [Streptomyces violascens]|uniref:Nosiheptide resistance regulatory protein n=1 Tax=Streptomyces violascens TaxID=67381 RepID=A0ABQ3QN15_9ACTN|nr:DUF5324 family protein [Streptomyces violascens]GGU41904.1 hypothetical protein GCM10010289_73440 [Streptomyces violascens]GHI38671.1 hypothetical protein Sviol_30790 [Streptomyces violascens]
MGGKATYRTATKEEDHVTRMESVRAATGTAKESVLHAAEVVAPYADSARQQAAQYAQHYAQEARVRVAPKVSKAAAQARTQARQQYDVHLAPRVPSRVDEVAHQAAERSRRAARQAADYAAPRVEQAVAAAQPLREEAMARSAAALAALRGQVTTQEIEKLARRHQRRARAARACKGLVILGILAGGTFAAWRWWDKQANPDWLVEPPEPTEVTDRPPLTSVDGSTTDALDPEVQAKQAAEEAAERDERR